VIHALQEHRLLVCRDATGKTPSQRNPNSLTNLRLDPLRGGSKKVLTGGIQQEHCRRINLKKPLHPHQQLNQKILNTEMSECDIGHRLDPAQSILSRRCVTRFIWRGHDRAA
jgi:hypothetical protein